MIGTSGCSPLVLRVPTVSVQWLPRDQAMANEHPSGLAATCVEDPFLAQIVVVFGIAFVELQP